MRTLLAHPAVWIVLHGTVALVFLGILLVAVVCEVAHKFYQLATHKARNQNTRDYDGKSSKES